MSISSTFEHFNVNCITKSLFSSTIKMADIQLSSGNIRKDNKETLKVTSIRRNPNISALFPQLKHFDNVYDSDFQRELISNIESNEDQQKYLLASGEIRQHLQEEKDLQVTDSRLNDV